MQVESNARPIVVAIDGTSASGKSTNAKIVARSLGYIAARSIRPPVRIFCWSKTKRCHISKHSPKSVTKLKPHYAPKR